jgi:hypothetical protein
MGANQQRPHSRVDARAAVPHVRPNALKACAGTHPSIIGECGADSDAASHLTAAHTSAAAPIGADPPSQLSAPDEPSQAGPAGQRGGEGGGRCARPCFGWSFPRTARRSQYRVHSRTEADSHFGRLARRPISAEARCFPLGPVPW